MKSVWIVGLVILFTGVGNADQGADSFATGFSRALEAAMQHRQQTVPAPEQLTAGYFDVLDNYGNSGGYTFATYGQCVRFLEVSTVYKSCIFVRN